MIHTDSIIDKICSVAYKGFQYLCNVICSTKAVVLSYVLTFATSTLSATAMFTFNNFVHNLKINSTFAKATQRGEFLSSPLDLDSYLKAESNFPNFECYFESHNSKILGGFFFLQAKKLAFVISS